MDFAKKAVRVRILDRVSFFYNTVPSAKNSLRREIINLFTKKMKLAVADKIFLAKNFISLHKGSILLPNKMKIFTRKMNTSTRKVFPFRHEMIFLTRKTIKVRRKMVFLGIEMKILTRKTIKLRRKMIFLRVFFIFLHRKFIFPFIEKVKDGVRNWGFSELASLG